MTPADIKAQAAAAFESGVAVITSVINGDADAAEFLTHSMDRDDWHDAALGAAVVCRELCDEYGVDWTEFAQRMSNANPWRTT